MPIIRYVIMAAGVSTSDEPMAHSPNASGTG
jgi:hypothetical protein